MAASPTDCVYAGVVAAPQASADPFNLSILVPATRTRLLVGRIQVTTRELNAKHADRRVRSGRLATSLQPAPISKVQIVSDSDPFRSGLRLVCGLQREQRFVNVLLYPDSGHSSASCDVRLEPKAMTLALKHTIVAILLILSLAAQVAAGPLEDAIVAYNRGDYETALRLFQQSADQGSATAQFNVGTMYANGQGVPQNYVLAYKWFSLSAAQGYTDAVKGRDFISARMTPAEVNEAQKLVPAPANRNSNFNAPRRRHKCGSRSHKRRHHSLFCRR